MSVAWHLLVVLRVLGGPEDGADGSNHQEPDEDVDPQVGEQVAGPLSLGLLLQQQQVTPLLQLHLSGGRGQQTAPGWCVWGDRLQALGKVGDAIALDTMQGNRASSCREGKVSWVFSSWQEPGVYSRVTAGMSIRNSSLFIEVRNLSRYE